MSSIRSVLATSACVLALGACSGSGTKFFVQEFGPAPNTSLSDYSANAADGSRISITQHTGRATLRGEGIGAVAQAFFSEDGAFEDALDDLGPLSLGATGDGDDRNPFYFEKSDGVDEDAFVSIASVGRVPAWAIEDQGVLFLLGTNSDGFEAPAPGDDVVVVLASNLDNDLFDAAALDYMAITGWLAVEMPQPDAQVASLDFGIGHFGLQTPEADMPEDGGAWYRGPFVGAMLEPGAGEGASAGIVYGDGYMEADFLQAKVWGGVEDAQIYGTDLAGNTFDDDFNDIEFEADITGATFTGTAWTTDDAYFADGSQGPADGVFYGPVDGDGPAEAGVVLTVYDGESDAFMSGVIGAAQTDLAMDR